MQDYEDIHKYHWQAAKPRPKPLDFVRQKLPVTLLLAAILLYLSWLLDLKQKQVVQGELFILLSLYWFASLISINFIWFTILKALGRSNVDYHINHQGISIENKTIAWNNITNVKTDSSLTITIQTKNKTLKLQGFQENGQSKALKAIEHYRQLATSN